MAARPAPYSIIFGNIRGENHRKLYEYEGGMLPESLCKRSAYDTAPDRGSKQAHFRYFRRGNNNIRGFPGRKKPDIPVFFIVRGFTAVPL